jgi:hypothetical protein
LKRNIGRVGCPIKKLQGNGEMELADGAKSKIPAPEVEEIQSVCSQQLEPKRKFSMDVGIATGPVAVPFESVTEMCGCA